jgi:beta-lactamase regulating signal transducer with metallopeptidase domain/ankyrin repeat protein
MIASFLRELEEVFSWLLTASWQASVLALFVLLIQAALGSRLNPRWRYALWLLVLLRLVLPALPESALSLFQFAPPAPPALTVSVTEPLFITAPLPAPRVPPAEIAEPTHPVSAYSLLAIIWLVGAVILLVLTWQVNRRFGRQVANSPAIDDPGLLRLFAEAKTELGVRRPIRLIENGQVQSPAIMGLFQPTLLLPADVRGKFDAAELRLIFLHELAHLKRGDVIVQAVIALLQILHWFNPVLWFAFRRMRIDREPATDALVLSRTGEKEKERYGLMLIKLLEHFNQRHSLPTLVGILEDKDQFKRRFSLIARFTRGAYGWSLLGVLVIGVLSAACLTQSKATETPSTPEQQAQTYLQVTYLQTTDTSAMPGPFNIEGSYAEKLIRNSKNAVTKLADFPLKAGMNSLKGKTPAGVDFEITLNWKGSSANKAQNIDVELKWLNAKGGDVSYGSEFKELLRRDECLLIRGPWKTQETSNLLIRFVDHPSAQLQKADSAASTPNPEPSTDTAHIDFQISGQPVQLSDQAQKNTTQLFEELLVMRYINGTPEQVFHFQMLPNTTLEDIQKSGSFLHLAYAKEQTYKVGLHYSFKTKDIWIGLKDSVGSFPGYPGGIIVVTTDKKAPFNLMFGSESLLAGMGLNPEIYPHLPPAMKKTLDEDRGDYQAYLDWTSKKDSSGESINQQAVIAVQAGDPATLQKLIAQGIDLKTIKGDAPTLLFYAESPDVAKLLVQQGVDVNARDPSGSTALHRICRMPGPQATAIVRILLEHGADANAAALDGRTPLMAASSPETVDLLIQHGADVNAKIKGGTTMLQMAAMAKASVFENLLRHGASFDVKKDGPTLMLHAAWVNNTDLIKDLLNRGVDPNIKGVWAMVNGKPDLMLPLTAAVVDGRGQFESVKLLLEHGARADEEMSNAVYNRRAKIIKFFWEHGVRNIPELTYEVSQGAPVADLQKLLDRGDPVDPPKKTGLTPLEDAAMLGNMDTVKLLIAHGANVNRSSRPEPKNPLSESSPLASAATEGQDEIVSYLLSQGGRPDYCAVYPAADNSDPYDDQRPRSHFEETVRLLINAGALKTVPPDVGGYLLSAAMATRQGGPNATVLKMLLDAGLSPESPMPYIVENGEKPNTVIGYYRDFNAKYKNNPIYAGQVSALKPVLDMLGAADKGAGSKTTNADGQPHDPPQPAAVAAKTSRGQIEIDLKVLEIPDDVYLANKEKIDAAVEKADIGLFNHLEGVSLLSTPSVTTEPGLRANVDIVREFPYPTSFEIGKSVLDSSGRTVRNIPPTPREFATKDVGLSAEITPSIDEGNSPDHGKIILNGKFTLTEFEGFTKSNLVGTGTPSFNTSESLFLEALKDHELKGVWIPGEHVGEQGNAAQSRGGPADASRPLVKKRFLLFVSANLVP